MITFVLGLIAGVALVINFPEILVWFVDSGLRDEVVQKLQGV
tara:strand:+ start:2079 stop:2204 length:126 start_codon:yes stop_codon:yes gene_type:complete